MHKPLRVLLYILRSVTLGLSTTGTNAFAAQGGPGV